MLPHTDTMKIYLAVINIYRQMTVNLSSAFWKMDYQYKGFFSYVFDLPSTMPVYKKKKSTRMY